MDEAQEADASAPFSTPSTGVLRVRPLPDRPGWRAVGEINLITRPAWEKTLRQLTVIDEKVCHLELSAVTFVDVGGASVLAAAAQGLPAGRRIMLHQPPAALGRLLDMFWPDLPAIEVVTR
ncbi:STAS domain-containing protein [Streptomyces phyllanthi]|uniref:STAS domain-containing protein n=1 Tax=Streptomyces phyllanthi TaxID=1803180 RepID=A0A5N8W2Q9_9ACTN|nr:STAS domain-containing protein [Streptomyces phyllanthi]MPY41781.1 STAS domain-containing protein [Streptomyces phyllanthi]